jgi:hypothetical protein
MIVIEMEDELKQVLRRYLASPIVTQEQVLYVLVCTRKLLELGNFPRDAYVPVRFICDWAVHTTLDHSRWGREVLRFFDEVVNKAKSWDSLSDAEQKRFRQILGLEEIRNSLMDFLRENHVPPIAIGNALGWRVFLEHFAGLVKDCPLKLDGANTSKMSP